MTKREADARKLIERCGSAAKTARCAESMNADAGLVASRVKDATEALADVVADAIRLLVPEADDREKPCTECGEVGGGHCAACW